VGSTFAGAGWGTSGRDDGIATTGSSACRRGAGFDAGDKLSAEDGFDAGNVVAVCGATARSACGTLISGSGTGGADFVSGDGAVAIAGVNA